MYFPTGADDAAITSTSSFFLLARTALKAQPGAMPYAIASAPPEASAPTVSTYPTAAARDAAYNAIIANPRSIEWVGKLTRDAEGDWVSSAGKKLTLLTVTVTDTVTRIRNAAPWILAAGAAIAGAIYLTRGRKRGTKRAVKRRSRPSWRRRIVTTWR